MESSTVLFSCQVSTVPEPTTSFSPGATPPSVVLQIQGCLDQMNLAITFLHGR